LRPADNPFASHRLDRLGYRPQGTTWPEILARLESLGFRAAVVGAHGMGKTACLEELGRRLGRQGMEARLERAQPEPGRTWAGLRRLGPRPRAVLLLDSAELVGALEWPFVRRQARRWRGCVVTAHRKGRLPTLLESRTSPELLAELVAELAPGLGLDQAVDLRSLWSAHRGDLRACLLTLFDHCAGRPTRRDP